MYDINQSHLSGTVEAFRRVQTSTGTPMVTFRLRCWQEIIKVVAFKELAASLTLADGARVEVKGRIQSTSWQATDGTWHNGFQVVAREIVEEGHHREINERQNAPVMPRQMQESAARGLTVYEGGPF